MLYLIFGILCIVVGCIMILYTVTDSLSAHRVGWYQSIAFAGFCIIFVGIFMIEEYKITHNLIKVEKPKIRCEQIDE